MILNILSDVFPVSSHLIFFTVSDLWSSLWYLMKSPIFSGKLQSMGLNFTTTSGVCHSWTKNTFVNGVFSSIPSTFLGNSQCQTLFVAERNVPEYQVKKEKMYLRRCSRKISPSTKINPSAGSKSLNLGWSFFSPNLVILRYLCCAPGWQDLAVFRRWQKWPWNLCNFRDKCVVFARNLKFSNLTQ